MYDEISSSYLSYAMSVIVSRALPDIRDGLKPVHRRILYAMYKGGYDWSKQFRKSARIVGDVIGKYHPHGDQSVYDALVRMVQDFSMSLPLIDGQGNFGSVDGDPPAAMRYTETRLSKVSQYLIDDIDKKTVDLTGIILTRVDGDGRGGAALSMKFATNTPIKFMGTGEKIEQLDVFHPDRIANRILGMGDVVTLVEKAAQDIDEEKIKRTEENLRAGSFSMEDYLSQLRQMKKMGGMEGVLSMLPGVSKIKKQMDNANIDENIIKYHEKYIHTWPLHPYDYLVEIIKEKKWDKLSIGLELLSSYHLAPSS